MAPVSIDEIVSAKLADLEARLTAQIANLQSQVFTLQAETSIAYRFAHTAVHAAADHLKAAQ